ncbi:Hypothetical predicted protein [Mytilus galloprovincialis]|uniref:DUF4105 domain-containing protein n=1 Tax=Mytilus galloprovincialis TaxID=29158 RepID=A0A8B6DQ72_MYTGA|nr:Hypothetical predicted protein [Mytilus galloprovincialis]
MVVRFYEWDPLGSALGHASLTLPNGTHISWWPCDEDRSTLTTWLELSGCKSVAKTVGFSPFKISTVLLSIPTSVMYPLKPHCMPSYHDDVVLEGREADRKVKLRNCILDQDKVVAWWHHAKTTEKYSLITNNCATMVIKALEAGRTNEFEKLPRDFWDIMMWTPYRAFEYCQKLSNLRLEVTQ